MELARQLQSLGAGVLSFCGGDLASQIGGGAGKDPNEYLNAKDNVLVALLTGCIPGIIYGLERYRQIQCSYIYCLQNSMDSGVPESACDDLKKYQECKYFWGEIFGACPIIAMWDNFIQAIQDMLADPFAVIGTVLSLSCLIHCARNPADAGLGYRFCAWKKVLETLSEIALEVGLIFDQDQWQLEGEYSISSS